MHGIAYLTGNRHVIIIHLLISTQPGLLTEFFWMKWILHNLCPDIKVEMSTFNYHGYHKFGPPYLHLFNFDKIPILYIVNSVILHRFITTYHNWHI